MTQKVASLVIALGVVAGAVYLWQQSQVIPLLDVPDLPHPEVVADPTGELIDLAGLDDPAPYTGDDLRREHNRLVRALRDGLAAWRTSKGSLRSLEALRARLATVRHQLGVTDDQAWHHQLAGFFAREQARVDLLSAMDPPRAGPEDRDVVRLHRLKQERLAGEKAEGYEAARTALLEFHRRRLAEMERVRAGTRDHARQDLEDLEDEFPELPQSPQP